MRVRIWPRTPTRDYDGTENVDELSISPLISIRTDKTESHSLWWYFSERMDLSHLWQWNLSVLLSVCGDTNWEQIFLLPKYSSMMVYTVSLIMSSSFAINRRISCRSLTKCMACSQSYLAFCLLNLDHSRLMPFLYETPWTIGKHAFCSRRSFCTPLL